MRAWEECEVGAGGGHAHRKVVEVTVRRGTGRWAWVEALRLHRLDRRVLRERGRVPGGSADNGSGGGGVLVRSACSLRGMGMGMGGGGLGIWGRVGVWAKVWAGAIGKERGVACAGSVSGLGCRFLEDRKAGQAGMGQCRWEVGLGAAKPWSVLPGLGHAALRAWGLGGWQGTRG